MYAVRHLSFHSFTYVFILIMCTSVLVGLGTCEAHLESTEVLPGAGVTGSFQPSDASAGN